MMWATGRLSITVSRRIHAGHSAARDEALTSERCESMAPFGLPVVPDV